MIKTTKVLVDKSISFVLPNQNFQGVHSNTKCDDRKETCTNRLYVNGCSSLSLNLTERVVSILVADVQICRRGENRYRSFVIWFMFAVQKVTSSGPIKMMILFALRHLSEICSTINFNGSLTRLSEPLAQ